MPPAERGTACRPLGVVWSLESSSHAISATLLYPVLCVDGVLMDVIVTLMLRASHSS